MHVFSTFPTVVSLGGSIQERINDRKAVAESKVSIRVSSTESLERCLQQLELSDRRLAAGPVKPGPYDWQIVLSETFEDGNSVVHFGMTLYDIDFFNKKKEIFTDPNHTKMFDSMGSI